VRALDYIEGEARRIRAIVDRLLDFSGNNRARKEYADLKTEIELVVSTVRYATARDSRVRLEFAVADSLPLAGIPGDEMRQIILNLVTNAVQAVGQADGVVLISAWADADGLYLSVQDTGPGIPEDVRARIFDPFFTTKANGSGLGLSVVYGLLRKCGGDCDIRSEPGTGTTFRLVIPIWEEVTHESTAGVPPAHMRGRR
jgi:two-component system NtrC family sensor kinase